MNIEYANSVPLRTVFDKMSLFPIEQTDSKLIYLSPFCPDGSATITVNIRRNQWHESTDKKRGNVVTLVCLYLKSKGQLCRVDDALKWMKGVVGYVVLNCPVHLPNHDEEDKKYRYVDQGFIATKELIAYLEQKRGIPLEHSRFLLREVQVRNTETGKLFAALGFANDEGGVAIRNPYLKAQIKPLYISFIRGQVTKPDGIHIFKDFMDYLSMITRRNGRLFDDDVIILNRLSTMRLSSAYIKGYGYSTLYTWLDNNDVGLTATRNYSAFCKTEPSLMHVPMNRHYLGYKDVNEWHKSEAAKSPRVFSQGIPSERLNEDSTR